jgi:hypothetical protein
MPFVHSVDSEDPYFYGYGKAKIIGFSLVVVTVVVGKVETRFRT